MALFSKHSKDKKLNFAERRGSLRNDPAFILAILYTLGFLGIMFRLLMFEVPVANQKIIDQTLPILSAIQLGIVQYFYTKTVQAGAERRDDAIQKLISTAETTAKTAEATAMTAAVTAGVPTSSLPHGPTVMEQQAIVGLNGNSPKEKPPEGKG